METYPNVEARAAPEAWKNGMSKADMEVITTVPTMVVMLDFPGSPEPPKNLVSTFCVITASVPGIRINAGMTAPARSGPKMDTT